MTQGIVLFGVNNMRVDYIKLAIIGAGFIKKNMPGTSICLITDRHSKKYQDEHGVDDITKIFDNIVVIPEAIDKDSFTNIRSYKDTVYFETQAQFKNESRASVYDLSPYDETLLLDSDYLICNNSLSTVWGSTEEIMINSKALHVDHKPLAKQEQRLNPYGIPMYWATAIYFRKGDKAKLLFDTIAHVKANWKYYKSVFAFPGHLYRNDYAFSIAIHILNGYVEQGNFTVPLPTDTLLTATDTDQFLKLEDAKTVVLFINDAIDTWKFHASRLSGVNVHCMNKLSLLVHADSIMKVLYE